MEEDNKNDIIFTDENNGLIQKNNNLKKYNNNNKINNISFISNEFHSSDSNNL